MGADVRLVRAGFGIGFKESWEQTLEDSRSPAAALRHSRRRVRPPSRRARVRQLGPRSRRAGARARRLLRHDRRVLGDRQHPGRHGRRLRRPRATATAAGHRDRRLGEAGETREQIGRIARDTAKLIGLERELREDEISSRRAVPRGRPTASLTQRPSTRCGSPPGRKAWSPTRSTRASRWPG